MDPTRRVIGTASARIVAAFVPAGCGTRAQPMTSPPTPRDGVVQAAGDADGDWDAADSTAITSSRGYDVRHDTTLDGVVSAADVAHANSIIGGAGGYQTVGRGRLSSTGVASRKGYAGYEHDPTFEGAGGAGGAGRHLFHVRHRVYDADLGRWTRRDPLGYVDGMSLYEYVQSMPVVYADSYGLFSSIDAAVRACLKQPTHTTIIECLEGLMGIYPAIRRDTTFEHMIRGTQSARRYIDKQPSRISRGFSSECKKLHATYKSAEMGCRRCHSTMDCGAACANSACWATALAYRKKYDTKCPAAGRDHSTARTEISKARDRCKSRCTSSECTLSIDPERIRRHAAENVMNSLLQNLYMYSPTPHECGLLEQ